FAVIIILVLSSLAAVISLLVRLRRAQGDERQQLKWLVIPAIIYWIGIPFGLVDEYDPSGVALGIGVGLHLLSVPAIVIAVALAIFKYRLYDIKIIINRALVYGALTASVVAIYILMVGAFGVLFQFGGNLIISLLATGLVAVLFQPLRARIQGGVNRLVFGERDDPMTALSNLGKMLETALAPDEVLPKLAQTVAGTLKLPYVAISLRENDGMKIVAEYGKAVVEVISLPLVYQGERVGQMLVALRTPREPFSPDEMKLLSNVARQAGAAVHAVRLTADLQRSRERLVTAREEERRRLRRDLHDGLGPAMASQTLKLDAALDLITGDPTTGQEQDLEEATKILRELQAQTQENVKNIRQIVYALRPPALDDLGLIPAIQAHIEQHTRSLNHLHISIETPEEGLPPLSAAVELAIYRIAIEALSNVIKHAEAQNCSLQLSVSEGSQRMLDLEVIDDGVGLPEGVEPDVGLASMRERAEELGGVFRIESSPSIGTRVTIQIPCSPVE
ncbi:MAG TPA: ATP-binding protein, partial [Anaerolineales bacterium]|nr:ATP-binding protein [Anaerolineales bacterium]